LTLRRKCRFGFIQQEQTITLKLEFEDREKRLAMGACVETPSAVEASFFGAALIVWLFERWESGGWGADFLVPS